MIRIINPQQTAEELQEDIVRMEIEELRAEFEALGIRVMTAEEEAEYGLDSGTPTHWQWRITIDTDGTLYLTEVYFDGDDIVGYVDVDPRGEPAATFRKALELRAIHRSELPKEN